jgi:hypothetical protein
MTSTITSTLTITHENEIDDNKNITGTRTITNSDSMEEHGGITGTIGTTRTGDVGDDHEDGNKVITGTLGVNIKGKGTGSDDGHKDGSTLGNVTVSGQFKPSGGEQRGGDGEHESGGGSQSLSSSTNTSSTWPKGGDGGDHEGGD